LDDWSFQEQQQEEKTEKQLGHRSTRSLSSIPTSMVSPVQQNQVFSSPSFDHQQPTSYSAGTSPKLSHFDELYPSSSDNEKQKIFGAFSLFEGSPTYKQRQRRRTLSFGQHDENMATILNPHSLFQQSNNNHHHHNQEGAEKVYTCPLPQCARLFKRLEHLKRHFRTHTMERPYSCTMCGKTFSRTDNLAQHKKTHNRGRSTSTVLSRCNSNSKLNAFKHEDKQSTPPFKTRKRASSLRHHFNELADKLSVLTSDDVPAPPPPPAPSAARMLPPSIRTIAIVPVDYFSYRGGDMSRCVSPSGSMPQSDEELIYNNYEDAIPYSQQQQQIIEEDICMTTTDDDINNAKAVMYDEDSNYDAYYGPQPQPEPTSSTSSSFMWQPAIVGPSCSTASSSSSLLQPQPQPEPTSSTSSSFMWQPAIVGPSCSAASSSSSLLQLQQQQQYYHRLSWYSSIDDKCNSGASSPSSSYYNEIYTWQQT
jgi:hypothetical protein